MHDGRMCSLQLKKAFQTPPIPTSKEISLLQHCKRHAPRLKALLTMHHTDQRVHTDNLPEPKDRHFYSVVQSNAFLKKDRERQKLVIE